MPDFAASSITLDADACITIVTFSISMHGLPWFNFHLGVLSKFEHFYYQMGMATQDNSDSSC